MIPPSPYHTFSAIPTYPAICGVEGRKLFSVVSQGYDGPVTSPSVSHRPLLVTVPFLLSDVVSSDRGAPSRSLCPPGLFSSITGMSQVSPTAAVCTTPARSELFAS